jgi:hypothetical protein
VWLAVSTKSCGYQSMEGYRVADSLWRGIVWLTVYGGVSCGWQSMGSRVGPPAVSTHNPSTLNTFLLSFQRLSDSPDPACFVSETVRQSRSFLLSFQRLSGSPDPACFVSETVRQSRSCLLSFRDCHTIQILLASF